MAELIGMDSTLTESEYSRPLQSSVDVKLTANEIASPLSESSEPQTIPFRGNLNIWTSKNNVQSVLTVVTNSLVYYKTTGVTIAKRGTEKNMAKIMSKNLERVQKALGDIGITHLTIFVRKAFSNMGHTPTTKNAVKLAATYQWEMAEPVKLYNSTRRCEGVIPRPPGGRRGRRV